jgi:hypothetical protein
MATDAEGRLCIAAGNGLFRFTADRFERLDNDPEFGKPGVVGYQPETVQVELRRAPVSAAGWGGAANSL